VKVPQGIVEDVLIKVDKFCFPMDFIVLDIEPVQVIGSEIPCDSRATIFSYG
jgi:hypothetical protein